MEESAFDTSVESIEDLNLTGEWKLEEEQSQQKQKPKPKKKKTSKYYGVQWQEKQKKWRATRSINGTVKYAGMFKTEIEAARASDGLLRKYNRFNSNAHFNFPESKIPPKKWFAEKAPRNHSLGEKPTKRANTANGSRFGLPFHKWNDILCPSGFKQKIIPEMAQDKIETGIRKRKRQKLSVKTETGEPRKRLRLNLTKINATQGNVMLPHLSCANCGEICERCDFLYTSFTEKARKICWGCYLFETKHGRLPGRIRANSVLPSGPQHSEEDDGRCSRPSMKSPPGLKREPIHEILTIEETHMKPKQKYLLIWKSAMSGTSAMFVCCPKLKAKIESLSLGNKNQVIIMYMSNLENADTILIGRIQNQSAENKEYLMEVIFADHKGSILAPILSPCELDVTLEACSVLPSTSQDSSTFFALLAKKMRDVFHDVPLPKESLPDKNRMTPTLAEKPSVKSKANIKANQVPTWLRRPYNVGESLRDIKKEQTPEQSVIISGQRYTIKKILRDRKEKGISREYLVSWKNSEIETWQPHSVLKDLTLFKQYEQKRKSKPASSGSKSTKSSKKRHAANATAPTVKKRRLSEASKDGSCREDWSEARKSAYAQKEKKPNAYFYRFNQDGEKQSTGAWKESEFKVFMETLLTYGANFEWGMFSTHIPGRVGYGCSQFYRKLIQKGWIWDKNYFYDEKESKLMFLNQKYCKKDCDFKNHLRYSFVVLRDPSGTFKGTPSFHPNATSDMKLKFTDNVFLQSALEVVKSETYKEFIAKKTSNYVILPKEQYTQVSTFPIKKKKRKS